MVASAGGNCMAEQRPARPIFLFSVFQDKGYGRKNKGGIGQIKTPWRSGCSRWSGSCQTGW